MSKVGGKIKFIDYKVMKVEYEYNPDFEWGDDAIDVKFDTEATKIISDDGTQMIASLEIRIFDDIKANYPFRMTVRLEGFFQLDGKQVSENIEKYYANALAILYPYARAIVSNYTANANIEPLILPTVNIWEMINSKKEK